MTMPQLPRIAHLVISLEIGGMERVVQDLLLSRNARQAASTFVYCLDMTGALAATLPSHLVRCFHADRSRRPFDSGCLQLLRHALHQDGIQILHSHNAAAFHYGALATRLHSARHVYTQHGAYYELGHLARFKQRWIARLATDRLIAVSYDTASKMVTLQGLPRDRIQIVPNGIAPPPAATSPDSPFPPGALVLGSLGGLKPVKGWARFIPEIAPLMKESPDLYLLLIGDGPLREEIESLAMDLGIADRLVITGYREDARRYLDLLDIFLLPSHSEGTSMALLEAMAAGLPCIVTEAGDSGRLVRAAGCGHVLTKTVENWTGELRRLLQEREAFISLGSHGKVHVQEHYTVAKALEAYEQIYQSLL